MALLRENQIASISNSEIMKFTPRDGESVVIKGIYARVTPHEPDNIQSDIFLSVVVNKTSIGYIPVFTFNQSLNDPSKINGNGDMWKWAKINGFNFNIPVGDGQKLVIKGVNIEQNTPVNMDWIFIIYDAYNAKDITGVEDNGAFSTNNTYFNLITISENITEAGIYTFDKSYLPSEFVAFPIEPVPSDSVIDLNAIFGLPSGTQSDTTDWLNTEYLRLFHRREVLFDDNRNGFIFDAGYNAETNGTPVNVLALATNPMQWGYIFKPKLSFNAMEELTVQVIVDGAGTATIPSNSIKALLLLSIKGIKA